MANYQQYRGGRKQFTIESMYNWPWVSIAFCLAIGWYLLTKVGNSATWLGGVISKLTNPTEYDKQQTAISQVSATLPKPVAGTIWTLEKNQIDANDIAAALGTQDKKPHFWTAWTEDETRAFNIVKNYTNIQQFKNLSAYYGRISTDGNILRNDLEDLLKSDQVQYLKSKGII